MALIKCSNCGEEISDKSKRCIHCKAKILSEKQQIKKINKSKKRRKIFKRIKTFILAVFIIIGVIVLYVVLGNLFPRKNIDFITKYSDYLDYALGENWEVTYTEKNKSFNGIWFDEYHNWTIEYRNDENKVLEFNIDNYYLCGIKDKEKASDYVFANTMLYAYRTFLNNKLTTGSISKLDSHINIIDITSVDDLYHKDSPELIDSKNGLSFKTISLDNLDSKFYYLSLSVLYTSGNDVDNYTIEEGKKIINNYKIKNAIISSGMIEESVEGYSYGETRPVYCIKNEQVISCPLNDDLISMNKVISDKDKYIELK